MAHEGKPLTGADVPALIRNTRATGKLTLKMLADGTLVPVMTEAKADDEAKVWAPDNIDKLIDDLCSEDMNVVVATKGLLDQDSSLYDAVLIRLASDVDLQRRLKSATDRIRNALTNLKASIDAASAAKGSGGGNK